MSNKKGQSLIEVTVALSILAIVFAGTVTLIINALNLNLNARDKTEAVAIAQSGIAQANQNIQGNCSTVLQNPPYDPNPLPDLGKFSRSITTELVSFSGSPLVTTADASGSFIKINSTVTWEDRMGRSSTYSLEEIVGKE